MKRHSRKRTYAQKGIQKNGFCMKNASDLYNEHSLGSMGNIGIKTY